MEQSIKEKSVKSFIWKTAESASNLGMTFVIQLILARILAPEDFGVVGITTVFITIANTIIEASFSSSVIQKATIDQKMLSSIFYANFSLSICVYITLFFTAPLIASFYEVAILVPIIRAQACRTVFSALYSIQNALMVREMQFKKQFFCFFSGSIMQGLVGIFMAVNGYGVWAIVVSTLVKFCVTGTMIILSVKWHPQLFFSLNYIRDSISFSFKILVVRITEKLFYNIRSLAIGRVYTMETLGYFNKGFQFPSTAMTVVDGSLSSVAFTSLSKLQNDESHFLSSLRNYIRIVMYLCNPLMIGMLLVAKPMVLVLLTDKWSECIPFLQIVCLTQLLIPLNVKTIAFEALGRSDISMILNVSGVALSIAMIVFTAQYSAYIMVLSGLVSGIIFQVAVTIVSKKMLDYSYKDQFYDMCSGLIPTLFMTVAVVLINLIAVPNLPKLILDVAVGVSVFVLCSYLTKNTCFFAVFETVTKYLKNSNRDKTANIT